MAGSSVGDHRPVDDACKVAHQAAASLCRGLALAALPGEICAALAVPSGLHHRDREERAVELAVAAAVEAVTGRRPARGWDRRHAGVGREGCGRRKATDIMRLAKELPGNDWTHAADGPEPRRAGSLADLADLAFELKDY